jgi:hypothetical protein
MMLGKSISTLEYCLYDEYFYFLKKHKQDPPYILENKARGDQDKDLKLLLIDNKDHAQKLSN